MASQLERYLALDQEIKDLTEKRKVLREEIGELDLGTNVINDKYRMVVTNTRSFSPLLAKGLLTADDYKRSLKTTVDVNLVKKLVAPEILDLMYETKSQTWNIKERDDV